MVLRSTAAIGGILHPTKLTCPGDMRFPNKLLEKLLLDRVNFKETNGLCCAMVGFHGFHGNFSLQGGLIQSQLLRISTTCRYVSHRALPSATENGLATCSTLSYGVGYGQCLANLGVQRHSLIASVGDNSEEPCWLRSSLLDQLKSQLQMCYGLASPSAQFYFPLLVSITP